MQKQRNRPRLLMQATGGFLVPARIPVLCAPETIRTSDTFFRREVLYPLSYEGVPIQYKAPRTASPHSLCSPPCVHRLRTPAPGGITAPTMYE